MRDRLVSAVLLGLMVFGVVSAQAQTPAGVLQFFTDDVKQTDRGDLNGAIEAFSRASAISSRLDNRNQSSRNQASSFNGSTVFSPGEVLTDNVTVIDPF